MDERTAVFIISVAAKLVAMHPSTLRKYEDCGLLEPWRQSGRLRLYSLHDIARLHQIKWLVEERGVNLAGVKLALELTEQVDRLRALLQDANESNLRREEVRELVETMLTSLGAMPRRRTEPDPRVG